MKGQIKNTQWFLYIALILIIVVVFSLLGVVMITSGVSGANQSSITTKVWVWNTEPNVTSVIVSPASVDLTPGSTTQVNCTAYVWDYNGWQDINISNASFYHDSVASDSSDDNNNHYSPDVGGDCSCSQQGSSDTNATCICSFDIQYYANNGTWTCNMTVQDKGGNSTERAFNFNVSNSATATINTVVGINVPSEIDYGNLSVTEISSEISANVTNFGNVPINISLRGYGGTDSGSQNNLSMICSYGNISMGYQRFSGTTGVSFDSMINLTNSTTAVPGFALPVRTNDITYGNDTNETYWRLQIPLTIGGYCNGTVEFTAYETII